MGHPVVAYCKSSSAAGWASAWFCGCISPINSVVSMLVSVNDGDLLCDGVKGDGLWTNADGVGLAVTLASAGPALYQDWFCRENRVLFGGCIAVIQKQIDEEKERLV